MQNTGKVNGKAYKLKATSPNRLTKLDKVDDMLREYQEDEDNDFYMFNKEFRAKYFKALADVILEWEDDEPDYASGDFEISELHSARQTFLGNAGMIGI